MFKPSALHLVAVLFLLGPSALPAAPPQDASAEELAASVTIHRDEWGVPHVFGPTDESVVFGYMYAQAEDNFWQIEDSMIQALGRTAEVEGESGLTADLLNRALEIPRLSREEWDHTPTHIRSLLSAGVAGLNYFLDHNPKVEPRLLRRFEPWHLMALSRFSVYQLFIFGRADIRRSEMTSIAKPVGHAVAMAPDRWRDLWREPQTIDDVDTATLGLTAAGSNMWAVTAARSESGNALLFINPHQPYFGPGQWYEGHLRSDEGLHFSGAGFFGSPVPTIGHNEHVAWSHTVNAPDILDVFLETFDKADDPLSYRYGDGYKEATVWTDTIAVKTETGTESRAFEFKKTHHGPILGERNGKALALRMAKLEEGGQMEMRYRMTRATSVAQLRDAMSSLATPMFNIAAADDGGNIWYAYYGAVPRRSTAYDWSQPVDGSDPGTEWQGYHPLDELPQVSNPPAGYVQNCNATPFLATGKGGNPDPADFPSYMVSEEDNPRSRISRRILEEEEKFSMDEWATYAFDTRVIEAEVWIPRLRAAIDAVAQADAERAASLAEPLALLEAWDGVSTKESPEMTLFFAWREVMIVGRVEDLTQAFETAIGIIKGSWGTWKVAWGEVNRVQRIHTSGEGDFSDESESLAVAGGPGPLGIVFNFYTRPQQGAKRRYGVAGTSFASVVELGEPVSARSILVFGESAEESSPHYFDQAHLFAAKQFKPAWFDPQAVKAHAQRSYHPGE